MDELLHWIEIRVTSSLRPRADDLKALLLDRTYRNNLCEFLKNEDVHTLYIFFKLEKASLAASVRPPSTLQSKCICFVKLASAITLTTENIGNQVISVDCAKFPLRYFDSVLHQVFLPLLSNDSITVESHSTDKIIEILHRFTGNLEVIAGHAEGSIVLPIPSTELLQNTTLLNKQGAAIHIMESTVIGWIRQIKVVLKHDPFAEIKSKGVFAGIYHEKEMWEVHIHNLESIKMQLNSAEAKEIVCHLEQAKSMYGKSITSVTQDVKKAHNEATENLAFLKTLTHCYDELKSAETPKEKKKCFFLILHNLYLVWIHSRYYHQPKVFANLLRLMSNEVSEIAKCLLGTNILDSPQAYSLLKEALKICATFRGNYLDVKIKADEINVNKMEEIASLNKNKKSMEASQSVKMYEVPTPWVYGRDQFSDYKKLENDDSVWIDSPWPLHNAPCFQNMNMFMERCNDVLDVVETMKHFEALSDVAVIGGAGTPSYDAMLQEIWSSYCQAKESFMNQVTDVLTAGKNSTFQKAFFDLRTTIKSLGHQLGNIIRNSLDQCPTMASQLKLLELFEGVTRRDVVKDHLKDKDHCLLNMFLEELRQVKDMYQTMASNPPLHLNMTPTISKLLWIKGLRARIYDPMVKLRTVSPLTLEGDKGWELRHLYTELSDELERFENKLVTSWLSAVNKELNDSLKLPLLKSSASSHDPVEYLYAIEVNLNSDLLVYLREAEYFLKPPFTLMLPESIGCLISHMNNNRFKVLCTRLEMVASKYNEVLKTISHHQRALFEKKLLKISEILKDGMNVFTWSMDESMDYTELATSYICTDLYKNFSIVTNNYKSISEITAAWCTANLDVFTCRESHRSYSISELISEQKKIEYELEALLFPDGQKIHTLVQQSFTACCISEASPAWQEFIMHIDAIVLQGLKKVTISSLAALLNTLLDYHYVPALSIDVELINGEVAFNPPLDKSTSDTSVIENIEEWLKMFLLRGSHIKGLSSTVKGGYQVYVSEDDDALELVGHILQQVDNGVIECQAFLNGLNKYSYLWKKDVHEQFQDFLHGKQIVKTLPGQEHAGNELPLTNNNGSADIKSHASSLIAAERAFILPAVTAESDGPLLEDFDSKISAYKDARDSIQILPDHQQCRWILVDFRPIKQVLSAYALQWMWIFTKYLIDQTTSTLKSLDSFLRSTEPQIESITGEERDTGSFMKMMRLFNEVSSKQVEMEVQFAVLQKTVTLLGKHLMSLPAESDVLYRTMPARWNSMKTKVSLAKQRLGPRIQHEADIVTRDLELFQRTLDVLGSDIETSEVYNYECTSREAFRIIYNFNARVQILQNEAKDLKELQELLEATVVDFSILNNCEDLLQKLSLVWKHVDSILQEQDIWKKELWQNMNTDEIYKRTKKHLALLQSFPGEIQEWDVYKKVLEVVNIMHMTLPLIEDLSNPAMRTRHWNQLVRQTGGMLRVTADSLKAMTLGDLLAMDLQKHIEDVRTTVQRAIRDVTIESSLKNCEEVWLSRIFDLSPHSRLLSPRKMENEEITSSISGSHYTKGDINRNTTTGKGSRRLSKQSDRGFHLSRKTGRGSTLSLYESLKHIEEFGKVLLIRNTDSIFEELEHHQLVLTSIQPYAEAGSFLDDVTKWQKKLQVIETTVHLWLSVQEKWTQMEEVFSTLAFRVAMPREANLFADVHHHFCRLMKSVEENTNILQNCTRRGLQSLLEMMNYKLERCQRAVRLHLEQKRQVFPRLFLLSLEDTLNIVCYGYDLEVISGYIVKIFRHVQSLIYQTNSQEGCHQIVGVRSFLGEELYLTKPLECSSPVENWLPQLVNSIKESLQHHLWAAMENTTRRREIHSAGARRVVINKTVSKEEAAEEQRKMSLSPKEESLSIKSQGDGHQESKHWLLNTLSDVAYLYTQIKFCQEFYGDSEHSKDTVQACLKILTEGIEHAAKILNEIPQKDILLHSERTSKAEWKGNGQVGDTNLGNEQEDGLVSFKPSLSTKDVLNLTNHILLLLYQRDVVKEIQLGATSGWKQSLALCYEQDDNTKDITVKIGDIKLHYGYEYQGSAEHMFITPLTERIFLSVMGAVSAGIDAMCIGPQASGKKSTIQELSLALGKPLFSFHCTKNSDHSILKDICKGLASSGAWVCINGIEQLPKPSMMLLAQFLTQIQSARHFGKEAVTLQLEEVPLNPAGACIAIIKRSSWATLPTNNYCNSYLPDKFLNCFRIVGVGEFPVRFILEAKLLLKGFSNVAGLAQKLCAILDSFSKLYNADVIGFDSSINGKKVGFSISELNNLLNEASHTLKYLCKCHSENQGKDLESMQENVKQTLEDRAVVAAIQNCWLSKLSNNEASALRSFMSAEWPSILNSLNDSCNTVMFNNEPDGLIPAVIAGKYGPGQQVPSSERTEETSVPSAIIKAAEKCHIFPSNTFVSKVSHLVQLAPKYQTVAVTGPAGCGKTTCIKMFMETLSMQGKIVKADTVYTKALQTGHLLGFINKVNGWNDGLLPQLLRTCCKPCTVTDTKQMSILHLDGEVNGAEMEIMQNLFCGEEFFISANNEQIRISDSVLVFWELETLANVSPSVLCCVGILAMTSDDIDWKLPLKMWMKTHAEDRQLHLLQLAETYLEPSLQFLRDHNIFHKLENGSSGTQRDVFLCEANVLRTFCRVSEALAQQVPDMLVEDIKKYFIFSCIWSFGGWLDSNERTLFSNWWRRTFRSHATFPAEGEVWDYHIDTETRHFVRWHDILSSYAVSHGQSVASEAFVHTVHSEQLLYLSSLLITSGCPVLFAGDGGCGKSAISQELLNGLCLGDVAEMSELRIPINSSTDPRRLWGCLKDRLEWRHGTLHTPAGNKKLLCLLDDLNLAKVNEDGYQPACEFVRQLLDQKRIFDPTTLKWKTIEGIIYLATWNTATVSSSPEQSRLLRHFCSFHCKYPSQSEQLGIFSSLLNAHFVPGVTEHKVDSSGAVSTNHLQELILAITKVSVELQERLRTVFLGTSQRCHYIFTLRDLAKIFRNICLSLDGKTTKEKLLSLWRHECDWVYGHRMSTAVDYSRYVQELTITVQKVFIIEEEVRIILSSQQPLFSNIVEDDGGLITTVARQQDTNLWRRSEKASSASHVLDGYQQTFDLVHVKQLLTEALREYNKVNPRLSITFYQCAINLLCRMARNLWSFHGSAHTLLCGEGCPRYSYALARLAGHLSGFNVVQLGSHTKMEDEEQRSRILKSQLVDLYIKAGLKGQKTLLLLTEEQIDLTALVYITEFVVFGSVSHLFTLEQQATVANAMRSEITNAGLTYSKENAWNLFLQSVQLNIRWLLIQSDTGSTFYKWCTEFSSLFNALSVYYVPKWLREDLVEHASYHIQDLSMLTKQEIENVCHLLSSMHLSVTEHARSTDQNYGNLTNANFEKFVQCFRALLQDQYVLIKKEHKMAVETLSCIDKKRKTYEKLTDELTHEKNVLEQHKEVTLKILHQIAQDKAVVEQKIHVVYRQLEKIKKFKLLLPEYQVALEKSEFKCSALIVNSKELVQNINITALGELRAMQKPGVDLEELMASIIIILKSPNADLTWAKGAKRQMANIDRFLNELSTFHTSQLSQSTLELLDTNTKKIQFTPENMERKTAGNAAAGSLMRWLQGAVQYYRILTSKVKPLRSKVSEMTLALEEAEQKMTTLQQRKKSLLLRLADLEKGFEEATMHKNKQQQRTMEIAQKLDRAAKIAQLLDEENKRYTAIVSSLPDRLSGIPGSTALAAGLVSYLGTYEHHFRQLMLTVEWPMAVKERGFPFMIDSIDPDKGRVIEFSVIFACGSPVDNSESTSSGGQQEDEGKHNVSVENGNNHTDQVSSNQLSLHRQCSPIITDELYMDFVKALIMRIVKADDLQKWSAKDWTPQQMENAAILYFSWQRPVILIDPCFSGEMWVQEILRTSLAKPLSSINLQARSQGSNVLAPIEKTISSGGPLILSNYCSKWDDLMMPLIDHCYAANDKSSQQGSSSIISFNGHRLLCADDFKLYLTACELEPHLNTTINSGTTIINYNLSKGSLLELLIRRAFVKLHPNLCNQFVEMGNIILKHQQSIKELEKKSRECLLSSELNSGHDDVHIITLFEEKNKVSEELERAKSCHNDLLKKRDELYPLARRGALFYSILQSLWTLADEYCFTLDFFLKLFDSAFETSKDTQMKGGIVHEDAPVAAPPFSDYETDGPVFETMNHGEYAKETEGSVPAFTGRLPSKLADSHDSIMSPHDISKIMDSLTKTMYQAIIQSLLPEHCVQACALLFLYTEHMENNKVITEEELAFFSKGTPGERENGIIRLPACGDVGSPLDDFHYLLVIRAAWPDRFPDALCRYVERLSSDLEFHDLCPGINNIAVLEENTFGVLVLEPSNKANMHSPGGAIMRCKAKKAICRAAKEKSIPLFTVGMMNGNEEEVKTALNDTMNHNGWLIIENLHLASKARLKNLSNSLKYAAKMRVSQKEERQFCVWLTSELGASIPQDFLAHLKKVSWHFLLLNQMNRKPLMSDVIFTDSLPRVLYSAILSALDQIQAETCIKVKMSPFTIQRLFYAVCVLHGFLQTQRTYPKTGLNHLLETSPMQLHQALNTILSTYDKMKHCDKNFIEAVMEEVNLVYACLALTTDDAAYIQAVVYKILSCILEKQEYFVINCLSIPIPSADVDPAQYYSWLIDHMPREESLLSKTSEGVADRNASHFLQDLSGLYDALRRSPSNILEDGHSVQQLADLRAVIDTVLEKLPPLIQVCQDTESYKNIDGIDESLKGGVSIHHGAACEQTSTFVLLQECNWINTNLKQIINAVSVLSHCLLGGVTAIPENLRDTAEVLAKGEVPNLWLPSHSCHMAHNIVPWLEGLHRKHGQLKQWVKKGLMPFANDEKEALTSINLGGLVNPEALLLALKVEFALHHGYLLHEVDLLCHIVESPECKPDTEFYPLCLKGLVLQGAAWDFQNNLLKESRNTMHPLPYVIITPIRLGNIKPKEDGTGIYDCPVYMDHTMQNCVMRIPMPCAQPVRQWHLRRVVIILNSDLGITVSGRSVLAMKQMPRNKPIINSLTKVDKSLHSRIFNRPDKNGDCLLSPVQEQEKFKQTDIFSTDSTPTSDVIVERIDKSKEPKKNLEIDVNNEEKISLVSGKIVESSHEDEQLIREDVSNGHQRNSEPGSKDDSKDPNIGMSEETGFMDSDINAGIENELFIKENVMVHRNNHDYEDSDNDDHGYNNGNFHESENMEYRGNFDKKQLDTFLESLESSNDHGLAGNQVGFNYEEDSIKNHEEDLDYKNNSKHINTNDDTREHDDYQQEM
ncbi:dynein beta chain, flagellar outer arm-like [Bufo bufo]|uniref:dynein beta chain, flagellar outer arm-like n=1 Tax=Bufo bufo TaxID=8384 RepID=UPI001ABE902E|nr:dynein beta chain, flagellar outer arm-like [Bufo bufo]